MLDGLLYSSGGRVGVFPLLSHFVAFRAPVAHARRRRVRLVGLLGLVEGAPDFRPLLALVNALVDVEVPEVGVLVVAPIHGEHT